MDANIFYVGGSAVKLLTSRPMTTREIRNSFEKFGEIKQVVSQDDFQIIYFSFEEDAKRCIQQFQCETSRASDHTDPASTGDTIVGNEQEKSVKMLNKTMRQSSESAKVPDDKTFQSQLNDMNQYLPNCSSPVLLNTMDPGFRLAYCHDVQNLKPASERKRGRMNRFSESIKKYMDKAPRLSTQELVLTNLPADFKEEDVYELCGIIKPEMIELKKTSNINVLYAKIRTKTRDDFENLTKILGNQLVNGVKVTTIPITKVENPSFVCK